MNIFKFVGNILDKTEETITDSLSVVNNAVGYADDAMSNMRQEQKLELEKSAHLLQLQRTEWEKTLLEKPPEDKTPV